MKINLLLAILLTISACGGGGGGGGGSTSGSGAGSGSGGTGTGSGSGSIGSNGGGGGDPNKTGSDAEAKSSPYPNLKTDPKYIGDQMTFDGRTFMLASADKSETLQFTTTGRNGYTYQFKTGLSYNRTRFTPIAYGNADAIGISVYIGERTPNKERWMMSLDGNWTTSTPQNGTYRYYGEYQSLDAKGVSNGTYPIAMDVDFNNIQNSRGADLNTGNEVNIYFTAIDGNSISGTISDQNSDMNAANFGLFGPNGRTVVGGYAGPLGNGMFIGNQKK